TRQPGCHPAHKPRDKPKRPTERTDGPSRKIEASVGRWRILYRIDDANQTLLIEHVEFTG
ncbi:hypothetical protein ACFYPT_41510, partial [Streptomyces sp. NPDC005529]|uniref:hypothetical protein n=1 Tax=unclassified Streptomyces TaxID=2593676 RepID=UPI0033BC1345